MKHIKLMGIELEGGWNRLRDEQKKFFHEDSSVHVNHNRNDADYCDCDCDICSDHEANGCCNENNGGYDWVGELASPPLKPIDLIPWINENYPHGIDNTCGAHIHLSFNSLLDYSRLMDRAFYDYFLDKMDSFGHDYKVKGTFWDRLAGKNTYCLRDFQPEKQSKVTCHDDVRYAILNACYMLYETYEIRVLPVFRKKDITLNAVSYVENIIESYLDKHKNEKRVNINKVLLKSIALSQQLKTIQTNQQNKFKIKKTITKRKVKQHTFNVPSFDDTINDYRPRYETIRPIQRSDD